MNSIEPIITAELPDHFDCVEKLAAQAFGPGRFARTAFRLRENRLHDPALSFVARHEGKIIGGVRQTHIKIGDDDALVLGPLVVLPGYKNLGIGKQLMQASVAAARQLGHELIILVGDEPYYRAHGFKTVPHEKISLPGPVDPARFLYCELKEGAIGKFEGMARAC